MSNRKRFSSNNDQNGQPINTNQRPRLIPCTAVECFSKMLQDKQFCDVTFIVGPSEKRIKAHKMALIARSDVFLAQFTGDWENSDIPLPQFDPRAFEWFLEFIYTDRAPIQCAWMDLLPIGHYFMVKQLVRYCADEGVSAARQDLENTVQVFQIARLYDQKSMMARIGEFMAGSFIELSSIKSFNETVDDDTLRYLLSLDYLRVTECDLFKIVLSVATDRAGRSGGEMTVAAEMEKFLPLLRFPTMDASEFRAVVDASGVLPANTVINLYRYFAATDAADKQAIASTWAYSDVKRRGREFVKFNSFPRQSPETILPLQGSKLDDFVSFTINVTNLPAKTRGWAERMPSRDTKGIAITGIGIQCPAVIRAGTEIMETFSCGIEIKRGEQDSMGQLAHKPVPNLSITCNVTSNEWTEASISPPLILPPGSTKVFSINAEIHFGPTDGEELMKEAILLQYPQGHQQYQVLEAEHCNKKVTVSDLKDKGTDSPYRNCRLIRGIRFHAM